MDPTEFDNYLPVAKQLHSDIVDLLRHSNLPVIMVEGVFAQILISTWKAIDKPHLCMAFAQAVLQTVAEDQLQSKSPTFNPNNN